jgi:hypothetical protein
MLLLSADSSLVVFVCGCTRCVVLLQVEIITTGNGTVRVRGYGAIMPALCRLLAHVTLFM